MLRIELTIGPYRQLNWQQEAVANTGWRQSMCRQLKWRQLFVANSISDRSLVL